MQVRFRPLTEWPQDVDPTPAQDREPDRWDATFNSAIRDLGEEIRRLETEDIIVQAEVPSDQIRLDGWPYANAAWEGPAVIVSFETPDGAWHTYPSDSFRNPAQNIKAVAMTLNRLRLLEDYGCAKRGQQYRGWQALPPGEGAEPAGDDRPVGFTTVAEAARYIAEYGDRNRTHVLEIPDVLQAAYRIAAKRLHPDRNGGDGHPFQRLQAARDQVQEHQEAKATLSA